MTWGIGYIYEGFLVWIIPSTYLPHRSVMWAYKTDFPMVTLFTVSFHVHMCLYSQYTFSVHMYLLCTPPSFSICTRGLHLTTLDSHVQILEFGPWWSFCTWSECAADPPVVIRVQQKLGHRHSSSSQLFSCLALEVTLAAREHFLAFAMYIPSYIVLLYLLVM